MGARVVPVMAASAAAWVIAIQRPWSVHATRKRGALGLMTSKRSSWPALRMRVTRKVPRRAAHRTTIAVRTMDRTSGLGVRRNARTTMPMWVSAPVRS